MRSLQNKPQVEAPSARYPEGRIKDDDGSGTTGTPVNEDVYGDMHQFFSRLMVEAGITPNEIAENAYDGFQLIEALQKFNPQWLTSVTFEPSCSGLRNFGYRIKNGKIEFRGSVIKGGGFTQGQTIITLPMGFRPSQICCAPAGSFNFLAGPGWQLIFYTDGTVAVYENGGSGTITGEVSFESISISL